MSTELRSDRPGDHAGGDASVNPYASPQYIAAASAIVGGLRPHRGTTIFVLGLISMIVAMMLSVLAVVISVPMGGVSIWMARRDLKLMNAGAMDTAGRGTTQAGMICGIVGIVWSLFVLLLTGAIMGFVIGIEMARQGPR